MPLTAKAGLCSREFIGPSRTRPMPLSCAMAPAGIKAASD